MKQKKICPYDTDTHRTMIREWFEALERNAPEARYSILHALNLTP